MPRPRLYTQQERITLPLESAQREAIDAISLKSGLTRTTWIQQTIREKLKREAQHE